MPGKENVADEGGGQGGAENATAGDGYVERY